MLAVTLLKIEGAYAPSSIRAYKADFNEFINFCILLAQDPLPASPITVAKFIESIFCSGRSSASIRRSIAGLATIHKLNRFVDPTKDPDVVLEMRRMHRKLGRSCS